MPYASTSILPLDQHRLLCLHPWCSSLPYACALKPSASTWMWCASPRLVRTMFHISVDGEDMKSMHAGRLVLAL